MVLAPQPGPTSDWPNTWSREACDDWTARFGGTAPGGPIGRALKPLARIHAWPDVRRAWQSYLAQAEAEFVSAARFASTYGRWSGAAPAPAGKGSTVEKNREALGQWLDSRMRS